MFLICYCDNLLIIFFRQRLLLHDCCVCEHGIPDLAEPVAYVSIQLHHPQKLFSQQDLHLPRFALHFFVPSFLQQTITTCAMELPNVADDAPAKTMLFPLANHEFHPQAIAFFEAMWDDSSILLLLPCYLFKV